jgi:hypothetical protein
VTAAPVDVVGSSPISFTGSEGQQLFVPLSALQFNGSSIQVSSAWATCFDPNETTTLLTLATAYAAAGELKTPPVPPPSPALVLTAAHAGLESNNILATVSPDADTGLGTKIAFSAVETDTYPGLASAKEAAQAVGVDTPGGGANPPPVATGLVYVVAASVVSAGTLPKDSQSGTLVAGTGFDVKAPDATVLFTIKPRDDYTGSDGLSFELALDDGGTTFTITATYDSKLESGSQAKITLTDLGDLPSQVSYLVTASAPPAGAALPAAGDYQLSGGAAGVAANTLVYTS